MGLAVLLEVRSCVAKIDDTDVFMAENVFLNHLDLLHVGTVVDHQVVQLEIIENKTGCVDLLEDVQ